MEAGEERTACVVCYRPADYTTGQSLLYEYVQVAFCFVCEPDADTAFQNGQQYTPRWGKPLPFRRYNDPKEDKQLYWTCKVCGGSQSSRRPLCSLCVRSQQQSKEIATALAGAVAQQTTAITAVVAAAVTKIREDIMVQKTTTDDKAIEKTRRKPNYKEEAVEALYGASAEAIVVTARNALVDMLVAELPESEVEGAKIIVAKVLMGKLGTSICAAVAGGAFAVAEELGFEIPVLSEDMADRLGSEFRKLAIRSTAMTAFNTFFSPLVDTATTQFGALVGGLAKAQRTLDRAAVIESKLKRREPTIV